MDTSLIKNRSYLNDKHRVSHHQIDLWLNECKSKLFLAEKIKQLNLVKKFILVTDLLAKEKIFFVCFKGPILSYRIYNDSTVRRSGDIDIFINKNDIYKIITILKANNFIIKKDNYWPSFKKKQAVFLQNYHHLVFFNEELHISLEVHWKLLYLLSPVSRKKMSNIIKENIVSLEFSGRTFNVFSLEFELLYLLIHGAKHGWSFLKWLFDIKDYPIHKMDIKKFKLLANEFNSWRIIAQVNVLLTNLFKTPFPIVSDKKTPKHLINYALYKINRKKGSIQYGSIQLIFKDFKNHWFLFPGFRYKTRVLASNFNLIRIENFIKIKLFNVQ